MRAVDPGPGAVVAVSAAAGGVGSIVVQLLGVRGARAIGIASPANADWLTAHGVVPVAYGDGLAERLQEAADPDGIDGFIDLYGPEYVQLAADLGIKPERIETIVAFAKAGEIGAKAEGSGTAPPPRCCPRWPDWWRRGPSIAHRRHLPPRPRGRGLRVARAGPHAGRIVLIP